MAKQTTVVTAIPYVNSTPHIGNVLTTLSGDVTARYLRMRGLDVFSVAGSDENGQKIKEAAEAAGRDTQGFVEEIADRFESVFQGLGIQYDAFVRTSGERHRFVCQRFFRTLQENGYIYTGKYEGWYDVSTETFFKESDLIDGKSPDGNPVQWVSEENYFFRLSAFQDRLMEHIEQNPEFILPGSRRNEVMAFIKQGLRDTAVSRANTGWGIPIPGREDQVIYVWFDALINYVTATGWPDDGWQDRWPAVVQWLGKDILTRFHATLWPAMLMGVGLPLPSHLVAHSWILLGTEKISKSKGNVVRPLELAQDLAQRTGCSQEAAADAVRHFLTATIGFENDSTFTYEDFDRRYNADLANDLGNALNRSLAMAAKFCNSKVPDSEPEPEALEAIELAKVQYAEAMRTFRIERAVESAWSLVRFLNKYIDTRAPWALAKGGDPALDAVLRSMLLCLRSAEGLVRPTLPSTADRIAEQLGLPPLTHWDLVGSPSSLPGDTVLQQPQPIFPRIDLKAIAAKAEPRKAEPEVPNKPATQPMTEPVSQEITIEDLMKVQLRVARVLEAEPVDGSDKLLKLQLVVGEERRQVVAGIRKNYSPEDLIGRQVVIVFNLKPAKLRGVDSQGMLLAATDAEGGAILLEPDREAPEGTQVR